MLCYVDLPLGFEKATYTFLESAGILRSSIIIRKQNVISEVNITLNFVANDLTAKKGTKYHYIIFG